MNEHLYIKKSKDITQSCDCLNELLFTIDFSFIIKYMQDQGFSTGP